MAAEGAGLGERTGNPSGDPTGDIAGERVASGGRPIEVVATGGPLAL